MTPSGLSNGIDDQAAHWAVEAAYSDMSPESRARLDAWLALDPRHRGAFARSRAALHVMEQAVVDTGSAAPAAAPAATGSDNDNSGAATLPLPPRSRSHWARRAFAGGAAVAASAAALVIVTMPAPVRQAAPADAGKVVALADGSVATLRHDGKIDVLLSASFRRITLLRGEATFDVAKDKARPFVVRSGDVYAQATGTIYSVGRVGQTGATVKVTRGSVLVWSRDERDQAVLLHAGDAVTLDLGRNPPPGRDAVASPPPELAQISFDNEPIRSAIARFNRVNSTKIVVAGQAIGDTRIDGLFQANDVETFARAAAVISGGVVAHENGAIVIKDK